METIIGFVVGYLVGSREGREGARRLRGAIDAIRTSPEVRRLAGDAVAIAGRMLVQGSRRGLGDLGGAVVRALAGGADDHHQRSPVSHAA